MQLAGDQQLRLRPYAADDVATIARLAGDRAVADAMMTIPHPFPADQVRRYLESAAQEERAGTARYFAIESARQLIGGLAIHGIESEHQMAELSFWVGRPFWNLGQATSAAKAALPIAFDDLELNRLQAFHMLRNEASGRVLEKIGFSREGVLRQRVYKWGQWEDVAICSMLAGTYRCSV